MNFKRMSEKEIFNLLIFIIAITQFVMQASLLLKGTDYIVTKFTIDDTYYYLQTAWNTKQLGVVTFDGLHSTNGVQILWFGVITLLSLFASTKINLLFFSLFFSFLLNALSYFFIYKIGRILHRPHLAVIMAGLWLLEITFTKVYSTGMEGSLHAVIFWGVVWQTLLFTSNVKENKSPNLFTLTIVLILNSWARFDAGFFSALIFVYALVVWIRSSKSLAQFIRENGKNLIYAGIVAIVGFAIQIYAFWVMGNSYMPVSGLIKSSVSNLGWNTEFFRYYVEALLMSIPIVPQFVIPSMLIGVLVGASISIVLLVLIFRPRWYGGKLILLLNLWVCIFIGWLVYHIVIVQTLISRGRGFLWHRSPSFIFLIITFSLAIDICISYSYVILSKKLPQNINIAYWQRMFTLIISLIFIILSGALWSKRAMESVDTMSLYYKRYETALWISDHLPEDSLIASWNAGQLGFFSNRSVINLDGLINSVDYYENVLSGSVPITNYLEQEQVDYVVDYVYGNDTFRSLRPDLDDHPPETWSVIKTFPLASDGNILRVWLIPDA